MHLQARNLEGIEVLTVKTTVNFTGLVTTSISTFAPPALYKAAPPDLQEPSASKHLSPQKRKNRESLDCSIPPF